MSKKAWIGTLGAVLLAGIVLLAVWTANKPGTVTIGAILPLTGDGAKYGEEAQRAIALAVDEVNSSGGIGGKTLVVVQEDDQGLAKNAVAAFEKLTSVQKVPAVIGPMYSSTALAVAPIAERQKVVLFSPSASSPEYTNAGDYCFRNWPSDTFEGGAMAEFAFQKLKIRRIAILNVSLDYGVGLATVFRETFQKAGGAIVIEEQYTQGATDFRSQLTKIKNANVQAVYLPGYYAEIALILKQARELALRTQFLSCVGFDNPKALEIAGEAAEGIVFARPAYDPASTDSITKAFVQNFTNKYGVAPGTYAAHAYDALKILALAMRDAGTSPQQIKTRLYEVRDFPGVTGRTTLDRNGDVSKSIQIMVVHDASIVPYK